MAFGKFANTTYKRLVKNFLVKRSDEIVMLEPHLGLGDGIICIGLVKALSRRNPQKKFYFACLEQNFHSIAWAFQDVFNVFPILVRNGREARQLAHFLHIDYWPIGISKVDILCFDESFYHQHQVPFELRWDLGRTPSGPYSETLFTKLNPTGEPYILVCGTGSHGVESNLSIDNPEHLKIIEVHPATHNIFDWTILLERASQIHTIDTGFIHFIESTLLPTTSQALFFHRVRNSNTEFSRRLPWHEIDYTSSPV